MKPASLLRIAALALIWGSGFLWIKLSLSGFTPVQLTWGRLALGAVVLAVVLFASRQRFPRGIHLWGHLVVAALLANAIPYLLFGVAEREVDSALAGAINATTPLWTVLLALIFRSTRSVSASQVAGLAFGFLGAVLILAPWAADLSDRHLVGALLCLLASASYGASYVYMGKYLTDSGSPPLVLAAAQLAAATGWLTIAIPIDGLRAPTWSATATVSLLILGAIGTGAAYVLNYRIITDDGPVLASTVTYLLPVVAVVLGAAVLDERLEPRAVVGIAVVLAGVAMVRRQRSKSGSDDRAIEARSR